MATIKQSTAIKKVSENIRNKNPKSMGEIMVESGYSKKTSEAPQRLTDSKAFQTFLATIDDSKVLEQFYKMAITDTDKRVKIEAGKEIFKLKDRYPKGETKIIGMFGKLEGIMVKQENSGQE